MLPAFALILLLVIDETIRSPVVMLLDADKVLDDKDVEIIFPMVAFVLEIFVKFILDVAILPAETVPLTWILPALATFV